MLPLPNAEDLDVTQSNFAPMSYGCEVGNPEPNVVVPRGASALQALAGLDFVGRIETN